MKKEMEVCDICKKDIATSKCQMCGNDICSRWECSTRLYLQFNGTDDVKNSLTISVRRNFGYKLYNSVCIHCENTLLKVFNTLNDGDNQFVLDELVKKIRELAKLEIL